MANVPKAAVNTPAAIAAATTPTGRPQIQIEDEAAGKLTVTTADTRVESRDVVISNLSDAETRALHARMEPLPDLSAFNATAPTMRAPSQPPPKSGPAQPLAFVVPTGKAVTDAPITPAGKLVAPLQAPQITPTGEVRRESEIRVRFSEPMVPVAAVGTAAKPTVTITPPVTGTWRWIDTRVLQFTATPRLPMATDFEVTVQPGVEAISGAKLATAASQKFSTAPISIAGGYPNRAIRPDAPIVIRLDQTADVAKIASLLRVNAGTRRIAFTVSTLEAAKQLWTRDPSHAWDAKTADLVDGRYVVLAPQPTWPAGTGIQVSLPKNAPSKEGPRLSKEESFVKFDVVPPFKVLGIQCGDSEKPLLAGVRCPANNSLGVVFSNAIAASTYRAQKIQIVGQPFEDNAPSGAAVTVETPKPIGRAYQIAIDDGIADVHGQPMFGPRALGFTTGPEQFSPELDAPSGLHVLDPRFQIPQWVVRAEAVTSVRVQLYQVVPRDYFAYAAFEENPKLAPPGKRIHDKTYAIGGQDGANIRVDLRPGLDASGFGHLVAIATATPVPGRQPSSDGPDRDRAVAWIQVTKLGVSARLDADHINAWVSDITPQSTFLAPRANVGVSLLLAGDKTERPRATTDQLGHVAVEMLAPITRKPDVDPPSAVLLAQAGTDTAFAAIHRYERTQRVHDALWYVTDDRFTYKPGESVYVKGWVRWTHNGTNPMLALPKPNDTVRYGLHDSRGTKIASGTLQLTDQGGFDIEVALPKNVNLGQASFSFSTTGNGRDDSTRHPISIQEFRTPAYSVSLNDDVSHSGAAPLILGESIEMTASARYYAGGGLVGAGIEWNATMTTTRYSPPGWSMFEFDPPQPRQQRSYYRYRDDHSVRAQQGGSLSGASTATLAWGIAALPDRRPSILEVDSTVTDVDRMSIRASSRPILVHPSAYYVGLRLKPNTYDKLEAIVTDIDGNVINGVAIAIEVEGVLGSERYRSDAKVIESQSCALTSGNVAVDCAFKRGDWKTAYTATATIADARGRANVAQLDVPWWSRDDKKDLELVPDKATYRPGDRAKIEIKSAITPATAIVTFARQGVFAQKRIELASASTTVELPIEIGHIKNVFVQVDRYAKRRKLSKGSSLPLPEMVSAEVNLKVDLEAARLDMRTRPLAKLVQPGEEATFEIDVRHSGKPVAGAEVALLVVDEAVLALSGRSHADPLLPFYRDVGAGSSPWTTFGLITDQGSTLAGNPGVEKYKLSGGGTGWGTIGTGSYGTMGHGSGGGGLGYGTGVVVARKDFRATAVFSPTLETDANGKVSITVKMPDSLTRFRIVALGAASGQFWGKAENTIVTQRKVNARTVAPRFLSQGDQFSLPVVVQNLDTKARTVDVAVRAANLISRGPAGKRVTIPAGQRAEVRFDFGTQVRGKAVVQTIMTSGPFADASNVELPIYEPATTEAFATYGVVEAEPQREQLAIPTNVFPDVGGLEVEVASTQLQSLTDAYWYLYAYPYECAEQRSGRMIATGAMYDILDAFGTPGRPTRTQIDAQRAKDVVLLGKTQKPDGGWGYFSGMQSDSMVTMQVLHALAINKSPGAVMSKATAFVTKQSNALFDRLAKLAALPPARRTDRAEHPYVVSLAALSLSTIAATGVDTRPRAEKLHALATTLGAYPVDAKARVLAILAKLDRAKPIRTKLLADLLSATHETASSATVTASYVEAERMLLVSSTKTNALVLDALIKEAPDHALITKLARGVLDGRKHGRWMSTQENMVALLAMRRYFDVYEKVAPNYTGKLWLGTASYAEQSFVGRSSARGVAQASWSTLAPGTTHDLSFVRDGSAGRMYYRVGIVYAPKQIDLPALENGFVVRRSYTAVDDPKDVIKNADGSYKIKLGAKVIVTIETLNTTTRHAVAVVDPLPAGFEAVNTALATSERPAVVASSDSWDHVNMRDNRSEAFEMELPAGSHRFSYTARATTPGRFIAAPAKAEEMYSPETFGRSTGMLVVVE
ncbi:MAG: Ig-like domain-containing protein [Deltaproteobacteria bacterium]|nr:Ig-like domain-containing protein [Deltaproteobacteria bacterium]